MVFLSIIAGLFGLGIVVFVHELGHFIAARLSGIEVEAFALGWGPPLLSCRRGKTEYRLCAFPVGGYCKLKGEQILHKRLENLEVTPEDLSGSLYGVHHAKRIFTFIMGPLFNFLFAVLVFSVIWFAGTDYQSFGNRIILVSDYPDVFTETRDYPATQQGLETGDIITRIENARVDNYRQIQEIIAKNPDKKLDIEVRRDTDTVFLEITPELDKQKGIGFIGIVPWIIPHIEKAETGEAAHVSGFRNGDLITAVNDNPVSHHLDIEQYIRQTDSGSDPLLFSVIRDNETLSLALNAMPDDLGILYSAETYRNIERNIFKACYRGIMDALDILYMSINGIFLIFKGIDLGETVSGPLRITYTIGQHSVQGFTRGFSTGILSFARFISFLSVALFFMNLLPLPALDGGMIVYNVIDALRKKPLSMKTFFRFQTVGLVIIGILLFSSLFNDIRFFLLK